MISVTKIEKAVENARVVFNFSNSRSLIGSYISIILETENSGNWLYAVLHEPQLKSPLKVLLGKSDRVFTHTLN